MVARKQVFKCHPQGVAQKGHQHMRFNPSFELVKDRTN